MGNCFSVLRTDQENPRSRRTPSTSQCTSARLVFQSVEERQPFEEKRVFEQNASDKSTATINGQSTVSENAQNSDELEQTPIKKAQTSLQEKNQTPTKRKKTDSPKSPVEIWQELSNEFKTAAKEIRQRIDSKMVFDARIVDKEFPEKTHKVHVLFTLSQAAALVDIRNIKDLTKNHINRVCYSRNALLDNGYHTVYAYIYANRHTRVKHHLKIIAEDEAIKIVNDQDSEPMSAVHLAVEIDKKLQLAQNPTTVSGATKNQHDETDFALVPELDHSVRLSDSDHNNIYTKLEKYASKWRSMGRALGFEKEEMDNIESNAMLLTQSPPKSYLAEMLSQWLQWAPGDGRGSKSYATRKSLISALQKANLGRLAESFQ